MAGMSRWEHGVFWLGAAVALKGFGPSVVFKNSFGPNPFWRGPVSTAFSTVQRAPSPFHSSLTSVNAPPARQSGVLPVVPPLMTRSAPIMTRPAPIPPPAAPPLPRSTAERMVIARERIRAAAEAGQRIRSYEVALDVDLSEFHFARQFRAAFGRSPHVYYDEVRAEKARELLAGGMGEGEVARRIGFRRPAELRALLAKRRAPEAV